MQNSNKPPSVVKGQIKAEKDNRQEELKGEDDKTKAANAKREQSPATDKGEEEESDSPYRGGEVDSDGNEVEYPIRVRCRYLLPNSDSDGNAMPGQWGYYYDEQDSDNEQDDD